MSASETPEDHGAKWTQETKKRPQLLNHQGRSGDLKLQLFAGDVMVIWSHPKSTTKRSIRQDREDASGNVVVNSLGDGGFGRKEQSRNSEIPNQEGEASSSAAGASIAFESATVLRFPPQDCLTFDIEISCLGLLAVLIIPIFISHLNKLAKPHLSCSTS